MNQISGACLCGAVRHTCAVPAVYEDRDSGGLPVFRHFCGRCSSPPFPDVVATPQLDWLKAGTLDDTSWLQPVATIWCSSAPSWVVYPEGVARFPECPPAV